MRKSSTCLWKGLGAIALCCALPLFPAQAADNDGQFATKGAGAATCQRFSSAQAERAEAYDRFRHWLEGYFTAANRYEPNTYDLVPWGSTEVWALIIDNYCKKNPNDYLVQAVQKLAIATNKDRLKENSPRLTVTMAGQSTRIYEEVLRRVQIRLTALGLYDDLPDGKFGPKTMEAIATFQISEGLGGTGLPDPLTVWKLVKP